MKKIGFIYGFIHLLVELICFQILYKYFSTPVLTLTISMLFDFFAFMPQSLFGVLAEKYKKLNLGHIGTIFILISLLFIKLELAPIWIIIFLGIGNALIHEAGAIATTAIKEAKLSPSAIFVGGGSFGVIIGQILGLYNCSLLYSFVALIIIFILILITNKEWLSEDRKVPKFNFVKTNINFWNIIIVAFLIVMVRSFIGYAIPISWKKELWQSVLLFFTMGFGKILGGILSDKFGAKKIGVLSTLLCVPFLIIGKDMMILSILGVFMFSMTMSITFGMLLSVLNKMPGLAFGITTIGLFLGLFPIFIFGSFDFLTNTILIILFSLLSAYGLYKTLN